MKIQISMSSVEGYWSCKEDRSLPTPIPRSRPWPGQVAFLTALKRKEKSAHETRYKGFSKCRICGEGNGGSDFTKGSWTWPSGFSHYVEAHNVKPTKEFIAFVIGSGK